MLDLGTGGGIPGLVLAELLPDWSCVLLDGRLERARLVSRFVGQLGWEHRVDIVPERAEVVGHGLLRATFDLVVARGFARPPVTAECAAPFIRPGGRLVVSEPPDGETSDERWPEEGYAVLGLRRLDPAPATHSFALFEQERPCPERFPRRTGIPAKRPLF